MSNACSALMWRISIAFITVLCCNSLLAQQISSATLTGRVEDASGASINAASIMIVNRATGYEQNSTCDGEGRFRFTYLAVGDYDISVTASGFAPLSRKLTLTVGQTLDVLLKLSVEGLSANVDVTGDLPVVETVRTQLAETVLSREIDSLPLNGRNYLDLAALTPGVTRSNPVANQRFPETSAVPGTGLSITGQRFINNGFVVDGLSANDDAADLPGTFFSQEVVREFEVISSGGIAEFGRASAGFVSIVTHSGTNGVHGRLYGFFRNQRLDARNPLAPNKDPLTQTQYGASLGGPINKNRTFFFANFEQTRLRNAVVVTITPANVVTVNSQLDSLNFSGARISTGIVPTGFNSTNFLARIDSQLSHATQLNARYSLYEIDSINARNVGGLNAISRGTALRNRDQTVAINAVTTLSSKTINETRLQFTRSRLGAPVNDDVGPAVNVSGVANFGVATFSPTARDLDTIEAVNAVSTQRGEHTPKVGGNFLLNRVNINFPGSIQGVYTFSSLANFIAKRYTVFQQAFGATEQFQSNPNVGLFVQDEWRPRRGLTINLGLRYDAQFLPDPITTDANNLAPRMGLAFAPGSGKNVFRASFGIYFDRLPLRATSNALQRDGSKYRVAVLSFGQPGAPVFPATLNSFPDDLLTSITTIDPNIVNNYSQQASLQFERELSQSTSLSLGFIHTRGIHLILSRNMNVPRFPASAGVLNLGRPDPRFANISRFESSGDSYYNAMTVSLNRRFQRTFGIRLSYTLSKGIDDAGNAFFFTPADNADLRDDQGRSDNDQRHRFVLSGVLQMPHESSQRTWRRLLQGFQLGYVFSYSSALPFNILTGNDRNFDTNVNDRPLGVARNAGKGFDFASLDLRVSRTFAITERVRLEALLEGFNVLNRANLQLPNNVFGTGQKPLPAFGLPTAASDSRQLQIGLRLNF
ncbi:MAG TPA: carboxypeptidase regulatory-like domain-containing protein [Pyrinomonadaceae bacterium]